MVPLDENLLCYSLFTFDANIPIFVGVKICKMLVQLIHDWCREVLDGIRKHPHQTFLHLIY